MRPTYLTDLRAQAYCFGLITAAAGFAGAAFASLTPAPPGAPVVEVLGSGSEIGVEAATPVPVGPYIVTISGSSVSGSVNTAKSTTNATVRIGNSVVAGGPVSAGGGSISCAFVTDENGVGTASTCPG